MFNLPQTEEKILKFWRDQDVFKKSLEKKSPKGDFVFYEGPPTANGKPGIHHVLARAFKDAIPRYKTMQGFYVERKAGWDTHGLPVELEVEKKLGLENKKDVENYGMKKFNAECKKSVWQYKEDWEKMTERIGFWIDMENPYITYDNNYIESLWWIIKQVHEKGLLYKGYKVIPNCPRCGTALSSHEVAQGYKNIEEESVYLKFRLSASAKASADKLKDIDGDIFILAWTTTPWTLPGNVALAINIREVYVAMKINKIEVSNLHIKEGETYIILESAIGRIFGTPLGWGENTGLKGEAIINNKDNKIQVEASKIIGKDLIGLEYEPLFPNAIPQDTENYKNAFKIYPADFVSTEDGTGVVHTAVMYGVEDYDLGEKIGLPKIHTVNLDGTFNELVPQWQGKFVKDVEKEITADLEKRGLLFDKKMNKHDYPFCWRCDTPLIYYAKDSWYFKMSALREKLLKNNEQINWVPEHIKAGRFGDWLDEVKDWAISRERYWGTPIPVWMCESCGEIKVIGSREELGVDKNFDLHRPFIDEIKLDCKCGEKMTRIPEVMDCWFDSGSMPFAQAHYPFENKDNLQFPADFISEAIDQTRGWFYTLLAVATLLDKPAPYKNVICLGHILDNKGQKMSKHVGNVVDPWEMIEKYGADAVRWYLYTINSAGEPKRFDEKALKESSRMFITLFNILTFYKMFSSDAIGDLPKLENVLDKWIMSKLILLIQEVTENLDKYDIPTATRKIEEFVTDLSQWYIRRSRDRFKNGDKNGLNTLGYVLHHLACLIAPFTPFMAEFVYSELGNKGKSVHLADWPEFDKKSIDQKILDYMQITRKVIELGLAERSEKNIKVRQPLNELRIMNYELGNEYLDLVKDEINVKQVICDSEKNDPANLSVKLNTEITPELKAEGLLRELVRTINGMRKDAGLTIGDRIKIEYFITQIDADEKADERRLLKSVFKKYSNELKKQTLTDEILEKDGGEETKINGIDIKLKIVK